MGRRIRAFDCLRDNAQRPAAGNGLEIEGFARLSLSRAGSNASVFTDSSETPP